MSRGRCPACGGADRLLVYESADSDGSTMVCGECVTGKPTAVDLNLVVLSGRLATDVEVKTFDSGERVARLLVTVRQDSPRRRVDVVPVTLWASSVDSETFDGLADVRRQARVWVCGSVQRRFWESPDGRRSRLEVVAESVHVKGFELVAP